MATSEQVKEKKKNRFRSRFLLTQTSSLDHGPTSSSTPADCIGESEEAGNRSSENSSSCSRMRQMLFRRSRSDDRMRNIRTNKEHVGVFTPPEHRSRFYFGGGAASASTMEQSSPAPVPHQLIPQSPPPPYDSHLEDLITARSRREAAADAFDRPMRPSLSPPSYDEVMAQDIAPSLTPNIANATHPAITIHQSIPETRMVNYWTTNPHDPQNVVIGGMGGYCTCRECQARYSTTDEEEQEDNCADAVFPIETHVLMQEVLADGMAFCTLM